MTTKIKSTSLEDNAVTTAKIASDAVTAAKIPANAIGNSELDLTASYAFSGAISGNGLNTVILANNTTGGTGLTEIAFDLSMDTSYAFQRFVVENLYSSLQNDMYCRTRKASNNTYYTGGSEYGFAYRYVTSGGVGGSGSNGADHGRICGHGIGNANTETGHWIIDVYNNTASGTGKYTLIKWQRFGWHSTPHAVSEDGHVIENVTPDTTNQFKLYGSGGGQTLSYSGYVHYGFKRA